MTPSARQPRFKAKAAAKGPAGANGERAASIPQVVAADIRRRIARSALKPGHTLPPEAELMEQYRIARPTLREALRILEAESLIVVRRGVSGGAVVQQLQVQVLANGFGVLLQQRGVTLADVYEARMALEPRAMANLARTASTHTVTDLRRLLLQAELQIGSPAGYSHAIALFQEKLIELAGNVTLSLLARLLRDIVEKHNANGGGTWQDDWTGLQRLSLKSHLRLLELVEAGDATGVEQFWLQHMRKVSEVLLRDRGAATVVELYR